MITSIPDIVYLAPANLEEFEAMLEWALAQDKLRVAVGQPVYSVEHADYEVDKDYSDLNRFKVLKKEKEVAVIGAGDFLVKARKCRPFGSATYRCYPYQHEIHFWCGLRSSGKSLIRLQTGCHHRRRQR